MSKLLSKMLCSAKTQAKNRVDSSQLSIKLNRIEKEKQSELKMLNTEKSRFRAKYMKSNLNPVTEIKMYETHMPGFCFKRNGEQRLSQQIISTPSVNINHLHLLLFTNGEVDIEKVLCLHLLSSHETKHLTPPKLLHITSSHSPLEQLIERSKEYEIDNSAVLPTYILDVDAQTVHLKDERLESRLITNEKILELVTTVMQTLEQTNPDKVQEMLSMAENSSQLKKIFHKPHIQDFVTMLKENSLINSCSSFVLTHPKETSHIEIKTSTGALEDLVRFIRSNVLQFPSHHMEESKIVETPPPQVVRVSQKNNSPGIKVLHNNEPSVEEIEEEEINPFRHVSKNFISRNIAAVAHYKRESEAIPMKKARRPSVESKTKTSVNTRRRSSSVVTNNEEVKVHSKQTTCPACMEKWKVPLPAPKVSTFVKNDTTSTNLQQRISILIHHEKFKLDSYATKYSTSGSKSGIYGRRRSDVSADSSDRMDLNIFDLEKIRQEIREKEALKKLERFLSD